jgi:hypothetical protein
MNSGFSRGFRHADDYVSNTKLGNTIGAAESKTSRTKKKNYGPLVYKVLVATGNDWPVYCGFVPNRVWVPPAYAGLRSSSKWQTPARGRRRRRRGAEYVARCRAAAIPPATIVAARPRSQFPGKPERRAERVLHLWASL